MSTASTAPADRKTSIMAVIASLLCLCLLWLAMVMLIREWRLRVGCNHWSPDIRWVWLLCAMAAGWSVLVFFKRLVPRTLSMCVMLSALLCAGLVFFLDANNLLVSYELWTGRGMPGPWE